MILGSQRNIFTVNLEKHTDNYKFCEKTRAVAEAGFGLTGFMTGSYNLNSAIYEISINSVIIYFDVNNQIITI